LLSAFLIGAAAGYAIAIPVGPIAVLIVRTALRRGFRVAAAAGAGTATVDLVFAILAVVAGGAVASALAAVLFPLRLAAAAALMYLAIRALLRLGRTDLALETPGGVLRSAPRTYVLFIGLTLLNPATVAYFVTLAVGLPQIAQDAGSRLAFAVGASLSSLSWQTLLAAIGAALHARLTPRIELATTLLSSAILAAFALKIAADALASR
jgi:threonine/homoserine/homoserine lactone efflux protein